MDYALRNTRVLIRRAIRALRDDEPIPVVLTEAVDMLQATGMTRDAALAALPASTLRTPERTAPAGLAHGASSNASCDSECTCTPVPTDRTSPLTMCNS